MVGQEAYIPQDRLSKFFVRFEGNIMSMHDRVYSYKGQTLVITYGPGPSGIYVVKAISELDKGVACQIGKKMTPQPLAAEV